MTVRRRRSLTLNESNRLWAALSTRTLRELAGATQQSEDTLRRILTGHACNPTTIDILQSYLATGVAR